MHEIAFAMSDNVLYRMYVGEVTGAKRTLHALCHGTMVATATILQTVCDEWKSSFVIKTK